MAATPRIEWVDLSSDVGERPGAAGMAEDFALLEVITSANVACGGHAGDRRSMRTICEVAVGNGVAIGAQVSYVDREGFGRRRLNIAPATLTEQLREQWGELAEEAGSAGGQVAYMRPHGALYNAALVDAEVATAVLDATPPGTPVLCLAGTVLAELATRRGHPVAPEIFADRAVTDAGLLVPRGTPGAVLEDPDHVADRLAEWLRTGHLTSHSGTQVAVAARSICLHSDTPGAVAAARKLRETLVAAGAALRPFADTSRRQETTDSASGIRATQAATRVGTPPAAADAKPSPQIRISQYGERAVLVDLEGIAAARLADTARQALGPDLLDSVPAATCVLLRFGTPIGASTVESLLLPHVRGLGQDAESTDEGPVNTASITIDVRYDGADLAEVAETLDISVEEVIELHTQATYRVAFFGFSPGFAYLTGLPSILQLPRRTTPRTAVPAGAVAVASAYTAVYPRSSPGGWHLLGHTDAQMFDADRNPPTLIVPGSTVRFRPV
ncbi:MAG: 5-oxoprolinase subunit PxpA [Actinobacteria bacterium]|nr:5-oxoprolinase subunit PxpA [Actinomycetota bacterium]